MKLNIKYTDKVEKLLSEYNGRAESHTYTTGFEVRADMISVERALKDFGLSKKDRRGCRVRITSGDRLPKSYRYRPIRTKLTLEWFPSGWCIVGIYVNNMTHAKPAIYLTKEQIDEARKSKMWALNIHEVNN